MRLGGQVFVESDDPEVMARAHREVGYRAASAPWGLRLAERERIAATRAAFEKHDVLIAEVGVWNNLMDPDAAKRQANVEAMKEGLALAEELGALCAVNIAGSLSPTRWDGPHLDNLSPEAFDLAVGNAREIIDAVKPARAKFTYEMMPFCLPDSPDCYLRLIEAVDRPAFGVHLDVVNIINGVYRYFDTTSVIKECFEKLGPHIASCHLKDIKLSDELTVHLDECMVGEGDFDIATYLLEVQKLPHQPPVLLEHLETEEEYDQARAYVFGLAKQIGVDFGG
ncbi:MAG TPA: sugar phosphate isomerase/epimerase [Armatimonadota bacterium]|nr:sugar phosphate isomerase/epimerase [Armatimonadota bacterium]